jgi:DNA invertase Pin-like site-specific DNA recombinase
MPRRRSVSANTGNPIMAPEPDRRQRISVRRRDSLARRVAGPPEPPEKDLSHRAAQYIRMSTDRQDCSPIVQRETLAKYAADNRIDIVQTYTDEGISGLTLRERSGLRSLLADIADARNDFGVVLVYDVSRWGRFQDCDESAHYEYLCRRGGVRVVYCAEPFANDTTPLASVLKGLKRVMAGEFSRELSDKVFLAKCSLARRGFRQGGLAGYGFRRMLVQGDGSPRMVMGDKDQKYLRTDRIALILGPEHERDIVRWVFEQIADHDRRPADLAAELRNRGVEGPEGRPWTGQRIRAMLNNEKYMGMLVFNRTSMKLKARLVRNPPAEWVRVPNAHPALVEPALFQRAQAAIATWPSRVSNESALAGLKELYERVGWLSTKIIARAKSLPGAAFYASRFGSLYRAYAKVGFVHPRNRAFLTGYAERRAAAGTFRAETAQELRTAGARLAWENGQVLVLDGWLRLCMVIALGLETPRGPRWSAQVQIRPCPEWLLIRRMTLDHTEVTDHWLMPAVCGTVNLGVAHRTQRERHERATLEHCLGVIMAKLRERRSGERPVVM